MPSTTSVRHDSPGASSDLRQLGPGVGPTLNREVATAPKRFKWLPRVLVFTEVSGRRKDESGNHGLHVHGIIAIGSMRTDTRRTWHILLRHWRCTSGILERIHL